jgi:hypothetical protein
MRKTLKQVIRPVLSAYPHVLALVGVNDIRRGAEVEVEVAQLRIAHARSKCPNELPRMALQGDDGLMKWRGCIIVAVAGSEEDEVAINVDRRRRPNAATATILPTRDVSVY